jgi:hypothetical protein
MHGADAMEVVDALLKLGNAVRRLGDAAQAERLYETAAEVLRERSATVVVPRHFFDPRGKAEDWIVLSGERMLPVQ